MLTLLTGYQTPAAIRRIGAKRLETRLRNRHVVRPSRLAEITVQAAERQHTSLPGEKLAADLVHTLAKEVLAFNQQSPIPTRTSRPGFPTTKPST
ncbi:hypothetical protein [Streptomyces sp. NPDC051677]|uniref:hypothetical protein n=1 Tax=Streptomyces sp. NPDC051677 TaxID=3365669 RepID=UPI0037D6DB04